MNEPEFELPDEELSLESKVFKKAKEGESFAQLDIGKAYHEALHVPDNCKHAFKWFMLSAKQNNMEAQFRLGDLYAFGQGVEKDEFTAYDWYLKSAIQGYPKALSRIHHLYHIEKAVSCRGQRDAKEEEYTKALFKKRNNIRELYEYRIEQLENELTHIKDYFSNLLSTCREQIKDKKQDHQNASLTLGFLYQHGYGIRKITSRAIEFYTPAAEKGNTDAAFNLGQIYSQETKIKFNYRQAFKWYTIAAEKGSTSAQNGLAYLYLKGLGTDIDYEKAFSLYHRAAESRNVNAMISLARLYRKGDITKKDHERSIMWYERAIQEGSTVAENSLEMLDMSTTKKQVLGKVTVKVYSKKGLCSRLHSDVSCIPKYPGLDKIKKLASDAKKGDGHAMLDIGMKYYNGFIFYRDKDVAFRWIKNAAKAGLNEARCFVAKMYKEGDCIDQDYLKASIWYMKAAKAGDHNAQHQLGLMYEYGLGVRKDPLEASRWYTFSANKNNSDAQYQLGILRENGEGLRQDTLDALSYFNKAAKQKNLNAIYLLATMYENGSVRGGSNPEFAFNLYKKAAHWGSLDAQLKLAKHYQDSASQHDNAFKYYKMAADQSSAEAKYKLAVMYLNGEGAKQDFIQAYHLFKESSELGYDLAINLFQAPIDYSKSNDIYYEHIVKMFELVCKSGIGSFEYNIGCHFTQDTSYVCNNEIFTLCIDKSRRDFWYKKAADQGHPKAQYELGVLYENTNENAKALAYFEKAHVGGNMDATYKLALMYLHGSGLRQDLKKAFTLFKNAMDMGHKEAYEVLHSFTACENDKRNEAVKKMLELLAASGDILSQYKIGILALAEETSYYNIEEAIKWVGLSSDGGYIRASYVLGLILQDEEEKGAVSEENHRKMISQYQIAADKGYERALFKLAQIYHYGFNMEKDYMKAFHYYTLAVQQGYQEARPALHVTDESTWKTASVETVESPDDLEFDYESCFQMWEYVADSGNVDLQYKLGVIYENTDTDSSLSQAIKWYSRAAQNSHDLALYQLGHLYETDLDYINAMAFYKKSSDLGNSQALYRLGNIYKQGKGMIPDFETAISYYMQAAEKKSSEAQFALGQLFEEGKLVPQDTVEAIKWYFTSCLHGNEDAYGRLSEHYDETYNMEYFYSRQFYILSRITEQKNDVHKKDDLFLSDMYYKLGYLYCYGLGTPVQYKKALACFRKATQFWEMSEEATFYSKLVYGDVFASETKKYLKKLQMFQASVNELTMEELYEFGSIYYHGVHPIFKKGSIYSGVIISETDYSQTIIEPDLAKSLTYFNMITKTSIPDDQLYYHVSYYLGMIHLSSFEENGEFMQAQHYFANASKGGYSDTEDFMNYLNGDRTHRDSILEKVFNWHMNNADDNNEKIMYNIGCMHYYGFGVEQNYANAIDYFKIAAALNHKDAQFKLGFMYSEGYGVNKNPINGIEWYTKAANQGDIISNYNLGVIYFNGDDVKKDYKMAIKYYKVAADQRYADAECQLGYIYENGCGVVQDYTKAVQWYSKAADHWNFDACYNMGIAYFFGQGVETNHERAFEYFNSAAYNQHIDSQLKVGLCYNYGFGVKKNNKKAVEWYLKAAEQGSTLAIYYMGQAYFNGKGVERNYETAYDYYKSAADQGNNEAQMRLAAMYMEGLGVKKDLHKALELYSSMSTENDGLLIPIGEIYHAADDEVQDFSQAFECYENSPEDKYKSYALRGLGLLYEYGDGVEQNYQNAYDYYQQAADKNNKGSYHSMALLYYYGKGVYTDFKASFGWFNRVLEQELMEKNTYVLVEAENEAKWDSIFEPQELYSIFGLDLRTFFGVIGQNIHKKSNPEYRSKSKKQYSIVSEKVIYGQAHFYLGIMNEKGLGTCRDHEKAANHFKAALSYGISQKHIFY